MYKKYDANEYIKKYFPDAVYIQPSRIDVTGNSVIYTDSWNELRLNNSMYIDKIENSERYIDKINYQENENGRKQYNVSSRCIYRLTIGQEKLYFNTKIEAINKAIDTITKTTNVSKKTLKRSVSMELNKNKYGHVSKLLKDHRYFKNISQHELSNLLGWKNGQYISNIERNKCPFPVDKINTTCEVLGIEKDVMVNAILSDYKESIYEAIK